MLYEVITKQVEALENNDFQAFLDMVIESGYSSYMYNQNIFDVVHKDEQVVSLALAPNFDLFGVPSKASISIST